MAPSSRANGTIIIPHRPKRRRIQPIGDVDEEPIAASRNTVRPATTCPLCDTEASLEPVELAGAALVCAQCGYVKEQVEYHTERGAEWNNTYQGEPGFADSDPLGQLSAKLRTLAAVRSQVRSSSNAISKQETREVISLDQLVSACYCYG